MAVNRPQPFRGKPEDYRPARGRGTRPPFPPGHTLSMRHGAYSPRRVDPLAADLVAKVAEDLDYLASDPSYRPAVWAWARVEARVQLISEYLDEHGPLAEDGTPRPALAALYQFERLASEARSRLGLDPRSRAALGRDVSATQIDLARLMAEDAEAEAEEQEPRRAAEETVDE